jgi:acylphosphatase
MREALKTLHLVMHGRVQGVWYRDSMRREAEKLGVNGWCRNRADGTVEAMVQGEADAVDALLAWARRGPELAQVSRVEVTEGSGGFTDFEVRGDA